MKRVSTRKPCTATRPLWAESCQTGGTRWREVHRCEFTALKVVLQRAGATPPTNTHPQTSTHTHAHTTAPESSTPNVYFRPTRLDLIVRL